MNKLQKLLGIGALTLALSGCAYEPKYLEGKVIKESGTIVNIVESSGALFGNESVKFGNPNYILTVETSEGKYIIDVGERYSKPLAALAEAIEVGDKIKFKTNYALALGGELSYFSRDRIGSVPSNEIELIEKAKK